MPYNNVPNDISIVEFMITQSRSAMVNRCWDVAPVMRPPFSEILESTTEGSGNRMIVLNVCIVSELY